MSNSHLADVLSKLTYFRPGVIRLRPPATQTELDQAETKLGFRLSPQMKGFLSKHNGGYIMEVIISGVPRSTNRTRRRDFDLLSVNLQRPDRMGWPEHWFEIGSNGFGDLFVVDLSRQMAEGESPILLVDHERVGEDAAVEFATDYLSFIGKIVDEMIEAYLPTGKLKRFNG